MGYTDAARLGEGYVVTRIRDFTWDDIRHFVTLLEPRSRGSAGSCLW